MSDDDIPDSAAMVTVVAYLQRLQDELCRQLEEMEPAAKFVEDRWMHADGGGGISRIIEGGEVFEKGGVNFSHIHGDALPAAATAANANRAQLRGKPFQAAGVSLVMHPQNPFVPGCHLNVRFFLAAAAAPAAKNKPVWWFGGGYDLTPCYGFDEDCIHWHRTAKQACERITPGHYAKFKQWCDRYFYLPHRFEARGIGGLFFDDYCDGGFQKSFALLKSVGDSFIHAYRPIVERRRDMQYGEPEKIFQHHRRGRYVEFNLVYDRGTLFGLQSGGRADSILMSLPPVARWRYNRETKDDEKKLRERYLTPQDWANFNPC